MTSCWSNDTQIHFPRYVLFIEYISTIPRSLDEIWDQAYQTPGVFFIVMCMHQVTKIRLDNIECLMRRG